MSDRPEFPRISLTIHEVQPGLARRTSTPLQLPPAHRLPSIWWRSCSISCATITDFEQLEEVTLKDEDVRFSLPSELAAASAASAHHRYYAPRHDISAFRLPTLCSRRIAGGAGAHRDALVSRQNEQGYWWADLTADTTLESDYILLQLWLHPPQDGVWKPTTRDADRQSGAVHSAASACRMAGSISIASGPAGGQRDRQSLFRAETGRRSGRRSAHDRRRATVFSSLGGIQAANSYVKINLSLFGLFPREFCPSVPPEMMLLPGNFIYQMSSWTRAIVIPLSIIHAMNPHRPVPAGFDLKELFVPGGTRWSWLKDREF